MQDVQNIPPPDDDTNEANNDFGSHSRIEQDLDNKDMEQANDAEDIQQQKDSATGIDQFPDTGKDRVGSEQSPDLEPQ